MRRALFTSFLLLMSVLLICKDNKCKEELCLERIVQYLAVDLVEGQKELAFEKSKNKFRQQSGFTDPINFFSFIKCKI